MEHQMEELQRYQKLLETSRSWATSSKVALGHVPLVWWEAKQSLTEGTAALPQYALMGHNSDDESKNPVLLNTNSPWSMFLCGSQGSGKSHTLSCILENCLLTDEEIGKNPNPLAGVVFHYNRSQSGEVCEAAYLCSSLKTRVRVLVSRSNYKGLERRYKDLAEKVEGNIKVMPLDLRPSHLNVERMQVLMAVGKEGDLFLYMNVLMSILRNMAIANEGIGKFNYGEFATKLAEAGLTDMQSGPMNMRLDLLESYVDVPPRPIVSRSKSGKITTRPRDHFPRLSEDKPDYLEGESGVLTIIDLTDPFTSCGKIIALDEAHNYMTTDNAAALQFTQRLLKTIREQRHQGTRVVIATQEPSINTSLIDLCNITMVHRCTSPAWFTVLKGHLAALKGRNDQDVFEEIVRLKTGESLLFCPTAATGYEDKKIVSVDMNYVKFRTRKRITKDGGKSKLAYGS
ncbi:hypothetical protein FB567DRAFT_586564 [Paraphoma chrysanthemicola]|uniref:AAA+ ATPase domain-containing protein n=1 Tax=Paraphoma chrysanthemicola TaxID=798071 RepID=A0A8K0RFN9_9PLEO|nr:hypothetical protein FB567DRAFT_586564 [Paraphoma chrysanthemicola]